MKVAITGASGFLGRYLVEVLTAAGHQCRGLSRSARSARSESAVEWVQGSFTDGGTVAELVAGADAVVHAAFDRPGSGFIDPDIDVASYVDRNLIGSIRLIEAARRAGVGRFVLISSGAVHDEILPDRPLDETHPLWPHSHYGATKAALEAFVHSYGQGMGFPICALRPTAIYGVADPVEQSRWYDLIHAVVRGETVLCLKGGKQVHARDVARATTLLLAADGVAGQIYHCTDLFITDHAVAEMARDRAGSKARIEGEVPQARHPIACRQLKALGFKFGGEPLLQATVSDLVVKISEVTKTTTSNERV